MPRSALLTAAITGALGLDADAADDAVATAINQVKATRDDATARATNAEKAQPSLDRYVPRADYDALALRATNAENALTAKAQADHKAAVDIAITAALKDGKITPATTEYHRASCADATGLARFLEFVKAAPAIGDVSNLDGKKAEDKSKTALNAEESAVARALGMSEEEYAKAKVGDFSKAKAA